MPGITNLNDQKECFTKLNEAGQWKKRREKISCCRKEETMAIHFNALFTIVFKACQHGHHRQVVGDVCCSLCSSMERIKIRRMREQCY